MQTIELSEHTLAKLDKMTDALELLAACLDKGNENWDTTLSAELNEDTFVCCNQCEEEFHAGEKDIVRTKEGDIFCVNCFLRKGLTVVNK